MPSEIPKYQTAAVVPKLKGDLQFKKDHPVLQPSDLAPGECLVQLECTGVCHTDLHAKDGDWPLKPTLPLVGGHEGVGRVVAIAEHTQNAGIAIGDRVGIKWLANSCLKCEYCRKGFEQNCVEAKLSGFSTDGTFAQFTKSWINHVTPIPEGIASTEAASILCAGVTVYRAIKHSNTHLGDWIVILGAGGGLGHLAVQYAAAMGLRVLAIDTSDEKKKLAMELGAEAFVDFKEAKDLVKAVREATGGEGAHAAIVTAANPAAYEQAVDYLRPTGTLVAVGMPADGAKLSADIFFTVYKSIKIVGSYVGNRQDAIEALDLAARGKVKVHYEVRPFSDLPKIYKGLEAGTVVGRVVLDLAK